MGSHCPIGYPIREFMGLWGGPISIGVPLTPYIQIYGVMGQPHKRWGPINP